MAATAASLSSPSTCLLSTPIPPTCLFSRNLKPIIRALNPQTKKPPPLSCVVAASKPGPWRDLFILNAWVVRNYCCLVVSVSVLEPALRRLFDEQAKMAEFRAHLARGETLTDVQAEAFAVVREDKDPDPVREAARRTLGMRHFDVQIIGGAVLHDGCIAEMKMG